MITDRFILLRQQKTFSLADACIKSNLQMRNKIRGKEISQGQSKVL